MSFYRPLLKETWQICRKYKFLWFFGFFALLLGSGGEFNLFSSLVKGTENKSIILLNLKGFSLIQNLGTYLKGYFSSAPIVILTILSLIIAFFLLWLSISSQATIINGIKKIKNKKETGFRDSFKEGKRYFWPILVLNIILKLSVLIISGLIIGPFLFLYLTKGDFLWASIIILIFFFIYIPLYIIQSFIIRFAACYIILEKKKIIKAIKSGFDFFLKNWLSSIELALILFLVVIILSLIPFLISFILAVPLYLFIIIFKLYTFSSVISLINIFILIVLALTFLIVGAFFGLFYYTSWTLFFLKLKKEIISSKLIRILPFKR